MSYLFLAYFIGFAIYQLTKERPKKVSEPLNVQIVYKPIETGEYVEFEEIK